jgi:hypothetical protein
MTPNDAPEPVRRIVEAMTRRALARCDELGIAHADFYAAMLADTKEHGRGGRRPGDVPAFFARVFRRLEARRN